MKKAYARIQILPVLASDCVGDHSPNESAGESLLATCWGGLVFLAEGVCIQYTKLTTNAR